jgi:hypothetical protein
MTGKLGWYPLYDTPHLTNGIKFLPRLSVSIDPVPSMNSATTNSETVQKSSMAGPGGDG